MAIGNHVILIGGCCSGEINVMGDDWVNYMCVYGADRVDTCNIGYSLM